MSGDVGALAALAAVDSVTITDNGVGEGDYQVNSVETNALRDLGVGNADLAATAVDSTKIPTGAIGNDDLGPNIVSTTEIRDGTLAPVDLSTDFNDMFTYQLASTALALDADIHLLLAWITPITTEMDLSPHNHDMTYVGTMTADDQIDQGLVYALDMDGVDDGGTITDHTDFFFDDAGGANGFTTNAWVYVVAGTDSQMILAKYDLTAGNTAEEWAFFIDEDEYLSMMICDDSEPSYESMQSDAALTTATWYMVTAVYDGAGGGSASAGITLYVDGVAVAATAVDNGSYTGMENLAALVYVSGNEDGDGNIDNVWTGDLGDISQSVTQLTSDEVWELYVRTRGYYNQ